MKRYVCCFLFLVVSLLGSAQNRTFIVNDTTFFLRESINGNYHIIFIDSNKTSKYYGEIANFKFDWHDSSNYKQSIDIIKEKNNASFQKHKIVGISKKWCPLYIYKGHYVLHTPTGFGTNLGCVLISDSTWITLGGEGATPQRINWFKTIDKNNFQINISNLYDTVQHTTDIHIIDVKKGIALFGGTLMVSANKIKMFPIIVEDEGDTRCIYAEGKYPVTFDKPDVEKLLKKK